jgi:uncharacterized protein involved in outer membrane biogenesis
MDIKSPSAGGLPLAAHDRRRLFWGLGAFGVIVLAIALCLLLFDWDWLRGPLARYASARTGREVRIEGHLRVHLLTASPTARVEGLRIGNPVWAGAGDMAQARLLVVSVRFWPLLLGRVELPLVELDQPRFNLIRDAQDRANWTFSPSAPDKPADLPPIQRFLIRDGAISLKDARRKLTLTGTVNAAEQPGQGHGFQMIGQGLINTDPFRVEATGGPLIHVRRDKPYPFHLDLRAGATHIEADGQLTRPFNLGQINGALSVSGPNLQALYPLTEIALPGTPPYAFTGRFDRNGSLVRLTELNGRIGDSDLEGSISADKPGGRRTVTADLASRSLALSDVLAIIGGGPKAAAAKGSPSAPSPTPPGRLLPDAPLETDRLRAMDAQVRYRAGAVSAGRWPLRKVSLDLTLRGGVLDMDPMEFDFPLGRIAGRVRIDARQAHTSSDMDLRLTNIGLQQFLPARFGRPPAVEGMLQGRAQLHGVGDTIHQAAASAQGRLVFVVPHGEMRQAFAELMGIDVANGLYLLLSKDNRQTDLRCAVAQFDVKDGRADLDTAVLDTGVVRVAGKGMIDLGAETIDLRLDGAPKKPRILRIWSPITVTGTLLHPKLGVDAAKAAGQVGLAAAVGVVLAPLAAVLPFVEPGLAKDADCAALLGEAKSQGAPVKATSIAAARSAPTGAH